MSATFPLPIDIDEKIPRTIAEIRAKTSELQNQQLVYALEVGAALIDLKLQCLDTPEVNFGDLFPVTPADRESGQKLPFSQNTANRLMAIASNEVLADSAHVQNCLPTDRFSLYELSRCDPPRLRSLIKQKKVHPEMTRNEVAKVVDPRKKAPTKQRLNEITREVNEQKSAQAGEAWDQAVHDGTAESALQRLRAEGAVGAADDEAVVAEEAVQARNQKSFPPGAILVAREAIKQLDSIDPEEDHFDEALEMVAKWIEEHREAAR